MLTNCWRNFVPKSDGILPEFAEFCVWSRQIARIRRKFQVRNICNIRQWRAAPQVNFEIHDLALCHLSSASSCKLSLSETSSATANRRNLSADSMFFPLQGTVTSPRSWIKVLSQNHLTTFINYFQRLVNVGKRWQLLAGVNAQKQPTSEDCALGPEQLRAEQDVGPCAETTRHSKARCASQQGGTPAGLRTSWS